MAQRVHAATDPHVPPDQVNDRARDVVDLRALLQLAASTGAPTPEEIGEACRDIFAVRAERAAAAGGTPRPWPPVFTAYPHWAIDYAKAAADCGLEGVALVTVVDELNAWVITLDGV